MRLPSCLLISSLVTLFFSGLGLARADHTTYPRPPHSDTVESHFGVSVADPYRPLEDLDAADTRAFLTAESTLTEHYLTTLKSRVPLRQRLTQLFNYSKFGVPFQAGERLFYSHNTGLQNQNVLLMSQGFKGKPMVAIDPNTLSADGHLAVVGYVGSHNGHLLAYGVSDSGSDWTDWHIRNLDTQQDLPDVLRYSKYYEPVFTPDDSALYYSAFPAPPVGQELAQQDLNNVVKRHTIGTDSATDPVIFRQGSADWQFLPKLSQDGRWLIVSAGEGEVGDKGVENVYLINTAHPDQVRVLSDGFRASFELVGSQHNDLYFLTTLNAPNGRVVHIDASNQTATIDTADTVVAESDNTISITEPSVALVNNQLLVRSLHDAHSVVTAYDLQSHTSHTIKLPGVGTVRGFLGEPNDVNSYYSFSNLITPPTIYRYQVATGKSERLFTTKVAFHSEQFEQRLVFYPSKDGTLIPMTLAYRKGIKLNGHHPVLLYGYGGFAIPTLPSFSAARIAWLEQGGIYAMAHIRGGGEYGERWHRQAYRENKQVVFDDFIGAGEWLIANHYTDKQHLAIQGGSNGGLLIGACITQRPDLFGAAIAQVGVLDMLRFQLYGQGAGWMGEFGNPDIETDFRTLIKYSPLHNVRPGTHYPATLIVTGDHDTRVMPMHSFKFAATLQQAQAGDAPIYLLVESASGHGGGPTVSQAITQTADLYGFLLDQLSHPHH
jgi:prolyl oligopeptidase